MRGSNRERNSRHGRGREQETAFVTKLCHSDNLSATLAFSLWRSSLTAWGVRVSRANRMSLVVASLIICSCSKLPEDACGAGYVTNQQRTTFPPALSETKLILTENPWFILNYTITFWTLNNLPSLDCVIFKVSKRKGGHPHYSSSGLCTR